MSYTSIEPAAVKFYYQDKQVLQVYMRELRLYMEAAPDVKIGIGVTNPTTNFDIGNYIFLKNVRGMTEKMSFQLTNPGYNNTPYSFVPVGTIVIWGGTSIPENWLECTGQAVLQSTYPDLYTLLGYKYTSTANQNGNASKPAETKVFQVPDFRGGVTIVQRYPGSGTFAIRAVGRRHPNVGGPEPDVDISTEFAPRRNELIQQFVMKSDQLPKHCHDMRVSGTDINGNSVTRYAMKKHTHKYDLTNREHIILLGGRSGVVLDRKTFTTGSATFSHKHQVLNCRLVEAVQNPTNDPNKGTTWNDPFSIEQQYIIMRYIIKAK